MLLPSVHFVLSWCTVSPGRVEYQGETLGIRVVLLSPHLYDAAISFGLLQQAEQFLLINRFPQAKFRMFESRGLSDIWCHW
jgi:hypothetical protein